MEKTIKRMKALHKSKCNRSPMREKRERRRRSNINCSDCILVVLPIKLQLRSAFQYSPLKEETWQYIWKNENILIIHSLIHSSIHSFIHSFTHCASKVFSRLWMRILMETGKVIISSAADIRRQDTGLVNSLSGQLKWAIEGFLNGTKAKRGGRERLKDKKRYIYLPLFISIKSSCQYSGVGPPSPPPSPFLLIIQVLNNVLKLLKINHSHCKPSFPSINNDSHFLRELFRW